MMGYFFQNWNQPNLENIFQCRSNILIARGMCDLSVKKQKTMAKIGTHNGTFHCDEALACFLLRKLPEYKDAEIVRYWYYFVI